MRRFVGGDGMERIDGLYESLGGWRALLYARLFLFSIYDFISYAAGFTPIRFWQYVTISTVAGSIPTFLFVAVGATLAEERRLIIPVYAGVALLSLVPFVFNRPLRRLFGLQPTEPDAS